MILKIKFNIQIKNDSVFICIMYIDTHIYLYIIYLYM